MTLKSRDKLDLTLTPKLLFLTPESETWKRAPSCVFTSDGCTPIYSVELMRVRSVKPIGSWRQSGAGWPQPLDELEVVNLTAKDAVLSWHVIRGRPA
jgi:hypothetical protein